MKLARNYFPQENNCFVLIPSGKKEVNGKEFDWDDHYRAVLSRAITEVGMIPIRAEDIYGTGAQLERVWRSLQEAEIVIADLTTRDPNVLYELGLAHVIGKTVILVTSQPSDVPPILSNEAVVEYRHEAYGLVDFLSALKQHLEAAKKEPKSEQTLQLLRGVSVEKVPASVERVFEDFLIVHTDDGRRLLLSQEDTSWVWRGKRDLTKHYTNGQRLDGAVVPGIKGEAKYSLTAAQDNPWPKLREKFPLEQEFTGEVVNVIEAGIFVKMDFGINGFVPRSFLPRNETISKGEQVRVSPTKIDPNEREAVLRYNRKYIVDYSSSGKINGKYSAGQILKGIVAHIDKEKKYILVKVADEFGNEDTGILPANHMSDGFRQRLEGGQIFSDASIAVRVVKFDRDRLELQDAPNQEQ